MKLRHRIGDIISGIVVVIGAMLDIAHYPYGKLIFYTGFLFMALSYVYYNIYLVIQKKEKVQWQSIAIPMFLITGVGLFFFLNAKSSLALIILALSAAMIQRSKLLTAAK